METMMQRREFLMLAHTHNPQKHKTEGSFMSEKLDGNRAVWIPVTRGKDFQTVPFANTNKDDRAHVCSGLWSRYGKPIFAPDWFLDKLPKDHPLDGELYTRRGGFQDTASAIKKHKPVDSEWERVGYYAFDIPSWVRLFEEGRINNPNFADKLIYRDCASSLGIDVADRWYAPRRFENNWQYLSKHFTTVDPGELRGDVGVLRQSPLPMNRFQAEAIVEDTLLAVGRAGGEGLMLRRPHSLWQPRRTDEILKVKRMSDAEGIVVGYNYGFGKLHGMIGSIRLRTEFEATIVEFDLSGFTDLERLVIHEYREDAQLWPGKFVTVSVSERFPAGSKITFQYRELTDDRKPKEARYLRLRPEGT